jgi:hypothetical protein
MVEIDESKLVAGWGIVRAFEQAATNVKIWLFVSETSDHRSAVSSANDRGDAYLRDGPFLDIVLDSWHSHD